MHKNWIVTASDTYENAVGTGLHPLVSRILTARGHTTDESVRAFLSPMLVDMIDPGLLLGIPAAVSRLMAARAAGEKVCIYGDYDVDGISGTALLVSFLRKTGFSCDYFIPNRFDDGYGLSIDALRDIISRGANLIVSVDCGITAVEEAAFCRESGADLIIVDHHAPRPELPVCCAVINPLQPGCPYPFKSLSGVGVAFNLLVALRSALRDAGIFTGGSEPDLREWLDLVALGTIADIVPLTGQNRIYVTHGLRQLSEAVRPGLAALKDVAGIRGPVSCGQVGFRLAPRLNAVGRMESAVPGVDLLLCNDMQHCRGIAADLDVANAERQAVERSMFDDAIRMVEADGAWQSRRSIVLASREWHQGVVGIVASRLVERYHRPTILIALDGEGSGKGSGRSIPGFHLLDALTACSGYLERFGGHRYAAGVGIREEQFPRFAAAFEAVAAASLRESDLVPTLSIDAEVTPEEISTELVAGLKRLEPFGSGNPEPVLMMRSLVVRSFRQVGDGHLRMALERDNRSFDAIAFRMVHRVVPERIDIAFYPEINEWRGSSSIQFRIKDLRPAE